MIEEFYTKKDAIKIETYWNVNALGAGAIASAAGIKIETYWNVNDFIQIVNSFLYFIKIETYWNVNTFLNLTLCSVSD